MSDKGVIIEEGADLQDSYPKHSKIKKAAQKVVLAGIGLATTATSIGLALNTNQTPHHPDAPSAKPTPALVEPPRTPNLPTPTPFLTTYSLTQQLEITENTNPHLNMKDFFKLSKEEQEKVIKSLVGKKVLVILEDADSIKLNFDSNDQYGNKVLKDIDSKDGVPIFFVTSEGGFEDLKKRSPNKDSDVNFPPDTRLLAMVLFDGDPNKPGIRFAPLEKLPSTSPPPQAVNKK